MSEREIKNLLEDIYDAIIKIVSYTKGMSYDDFIGDDKTVDAVVRNFEIIGEHQTEFLMILKPTILK